LFCFFGCLTITVFCRALPVFGQEGEQYTKNRPKKQDRSFFFNDKTISASIRRRDRTRPCANRSTGTSLSPQFQAAM
jgi:hypothetical protein